jgi:hypothetical protein
MPAFVKRNLSRNRFHADTYATFKRSHEPALPAAGDGGEQLSKLSIQSALITAVAIAGFAVGRAWPAAPADDRAYYVKAIENSLAECLENLKAKEGEH